jgi:hypothetical protein
MLLQYVRSRFPPVPLVRLHSKLSLGARPAGECTCDRAATENTAVTGDACACGKRSAGERA